MAFTSVLTGPLAVPQGAFLDFSAQELQLMSSRAGGWWGGEQLREFWELIPEGQDKGQWEGVGALSAVCREVVIELSVTITGLISAFSVCSESQCEGICLADKCFNMLHWSATTLQSHSCCSAWVAKCSEFKRCVCDSSGIPLQISSPSRMAAGAMRGGGNWY